jgi:quinoprotein glucose dehydrogenase
VIVIAAAAGLWDLVAETQATPDTATAEWQSYGCDPGGSRYSPLTAINRDNVQRLEVAWVYRTGDWSDGEGEFGTTSAFEATPLLVDRTLYLASPFNRIIALDPGTGKEKWTFDPKIDLSADYGNQLTSRGVSFWRDSKHPEDPSTHRIYATTNDARLIALNAATGKPSADFANGGEINLNEGVGKALYPGEYQLTSPPTIAGNLVIVGSAISDNERIDAPSGVVRAYDARDGSLKWSWDLAPPSGPANKDLVSDAGYALATPNVWAVMSVDEDRDLVFVPTGNPAPDYYGGMRNGNDYYGSSVVAMRASTGEVVWHFQTVHHDLWDFDVPAQPTLTHVVRDGKQVPVVIQPTKMGLIFTLHRETGKPIFEVEERPVPQSTVPGEKTSPTQPFPVKPLPLVRTTLSPQDGWGPLGLGREEARKAIAACHFEGMYTPPQLNKPTLMYPGNAGGSNWGGVAVDPERQILIANVIDAAWEVMLFPADQVDQVRKKHPRIEIGQQRGTPYAMTRRLLLSPLDVPCNPPPWGTLAAIDLTSGDILWQEPLGTVRDLSPVPLPVRYGTPNLGGPMVTGGGLIFIGAAMDNYLRAFDIDSGRELWKRRLPAGGQATPMTYRLSENEPQMVVIAAGGHGRMGSKLGDYVVAFAPRAARTTFVLLVLETLLALVVVAVLGRLLFPYSKRDENGVPLASRTRRFFGSLARAVLLLPAVGLVLPGLLPGQHWLLPASAMTLAAILACAALANLLAWRPASFLVAGLLLAMTCGIAYWELGELYWIGVLPA